MAVTITAQEVQDELSQTSAAPLNLKFQRRFDVAREAVQKYVGTDGAPDAVMNESVLRVVGYLNESPNAAVSSYSGAVATSFMPGARAALRYSGAMSLLSPYRIRRGGVI